MVRGEGGGTFVSDYVEGVDLELEEQTNDMQLAIRIYVGEWMEGECTLFHTYHECMLCLYAAQ